MRATPTTHRTRRRSTADATYTARLSATSARCHMRGLRAAIMQRLTPHEGTLVHVKVPLDELRGDQLQAIIVTRKNFNKVWFQALQALRMCVAERLRER